MGELLEEGGRMASLRSKVRTHCTWKKELIPIKMILFLFGGGMVAFLPFLTLQMRQIGITVQEMAIIHAFLPIASLLGPPTSGLVADMFGKYRAVLCGNIVLTLILHCLLLQVPPRPSNTLTLTCGNGGHALTWDYCSPCHREGGEYGDPMLPLTIKDCKSTCSNTSGKEPLRLCLQDDTAAITCHSLNESSHQFILHGSLLSWRQAPNTTATTIATTPPPLLLPPPPPQSLPFTTTTTTTTNTCGHTFTLIRESDGGGSSNNSDSSGSSGRGREEDNKEEGITENQTRKRTNELTKTDKLKSKDNVNANSNSSSSSNSSNSSNSSSKGHKDIKQPKTNYLQQESNQNTENSTTKITNSTDISSSSSSSSIGWRGLTCPSSASACPLRCRVEGVPVCVDPEDPSQSTLTFWVYFAIRLTGTFFLASSFTMMDATSLALVKQHDAEFGKQRILATIGQATVPLLAGIIVDAHSASLGYSDYMPAIYLGCSLSLVAVLLVIRLDVKVEMGNDSVLKDLRQLVTKVEIDLFLLMILVLGSNWGFIESYLFLYLKELNAPNYLLGLTMTVGCITGVPIMYVADTVIDKMGRPAIFIVSFLGYSVRHFGYAFMTDPWLVFPYEVLEIFTYQLMWVAAATYCPILAPKGLLATMTGLAGSTHYSLGRGLGSLFGGYLIANLGLQETFKIYGYISLSGGIIYFLLHFFYLRKKVQDKGQKEEQEEEKIKEEELPMIHLGLRRGSEGLALSMENVRIKKK